MKKSELRKLIKEEILKEAGSPEMNTLMQDIDAAINKILDPAGEPLHYSLSVKHPKDKQTMINIVLYGKTL